MLATYHDTYRTVQKMTVNGRELEATVLARAAQKLRICQDNWNTPQRSSLLDEALKYNQRLWTFFQTEISSADNPLPRGLKENLLSLSIFVDKRTFDIISAPSKDKLDALIRINSNIAAGLRGIG